MTDTPHPAEALEKLAQRLHMPNSPLLRRAVTHSSYTNENGFSQDNERLEFLGDAILDFIVGDWLYRHCPEMSEGDMTKTRSALVRTEQLAQFARTINLGDALLIGKGEEQHGGRTRDSLLCASFEALVGALYLERGLDAVREFVTPFIEETAPIVSLEEEKIDPKSAFQKWAQGNHLGTPSYEIVDAYGPDHQKTFVAAVRLGSEEYGRGEGASKHQAQENAARDALSKIENL